MKPDTKYLNNVTAIMTTYNETSNIERVLNSYLNQSVLANELIIVDGGSMDSTIEKILSFSEKYDFLNIKVIVEPTANFKFTMSPIARGRNVAINNAKTEYIVGIDAGCELDKYYIENISKPLIDSSDIDVVTGWYKGKETTKTQKLYNRVILPNSKNLEKLKYLPSSRSIAFKKQCWEKVGGYPEIYLTGEDTLFDLKLLKLGCKFFLQKEAFVVWDSPKTFKEIWKKHFSYGKGKGFTKLFVAKSFIKILLLFFPYYLLKYRNLNSMALKYFVSLADSFGFIKGYYERIIYDIKK